MANSATMKAMPLPAENERSDQERAKRIEEIRRRVADGTYKIDALELSKAILKKHLPRPDPESEPKR